MSNTEFLICIALALVFWFLCIFNRYVKNQRRFNEDTIELGSRELNLRMQVDLNIPSILESVINEIFNDYKVLVLLPEDNLYITEEREEQIRRDLVSMVSKRMSPDIMEKMYTYYNEATFDKVLADKIYLIVTNYVWEINTKYQSQQHTQE